MKRWITPLIVAFLLVAPCWAQTLGETTTQVRDSAAKLIASQTSATTSWGQQTALDDVRLVQDKAAALLAALGGTDAVAVKTLQQELTTASRRMQTSQTLLPESAAPEIAAIAAQIVAIDARLTDLRLRFGEQASQTTTPLADVSLANDDGALGEYANTNELLIDVRDVRRLVSSLDVGRFPRFGFGFQQPNNLDSLQIRRLVLASWALQRALEGLSGDISQVQDEWETFKHEYDRMGYPGSSTVTRQLERDMKRLTAFFDSAFGDVDSRNVSPVP